MDATAGCPQPFYISQIIHHYSNFCSSNGQAKKLSRFLAKPGHFKELNLTTIGNIGKIGSPNTAICSQYGDLPDQGRRKLLKFAQIAYNTVLYEIRIN